MSRQTDTAALGRRSFATASPPRRLLLGLAGSVLVLLALANAAHAAQIVLPPGKVLNVTQADFNSCNKESYGYQLDGGAQHELASTPGGCLERQVANASIGPFESEELVNFYLTDESCNYTFSSEEADHARLEGEPLLMKLYDGGYGCPYPPGTQAEGARDDGYGNLEGTVTIGTEPAVNPPEFGRCVKLTGKTGDYSDSKCTKNVAGAKTEDRYAWYPGPGAHNKFTTSAGESVFFETHEGYHGVCAGESGEGEFVTGGDNKEVALTVVFSGCKVVTSPDGVINGASCQSAGKAAGEVADSPLIGEAGWENKGKGTTAMLFEPAPGYEEVFASWECAGYHFTATTHGRGVLVKIHNDKMTAKETLKFSQAKGIQKPDVWHVGERSEETAFLECNEPEYFGAVGIGIALNLANEEKLELNATT